MPTLQKLSTYGVRTSHCISLSMRYIVAGEEQRTSHSIVYVSPEEARERETTTIRKKIFLEIFEKTRGTISVTCEKTGISRATFYNWMTNDPRFREAVMEIVREKPIILEERMFLMALKGDYKALKYMLDRTHPDYKKLRRENKESIVHIYHHATPPEGEGDRVKICLEDILAIGEVMAHSKSTKEIPPQYRKTIDQYWPVIAATLGILPGSEKYEKMSNLSNLPESDATGTGQNPVPTNP